MTQFLICRVCDSYYALEATAVREVVPLPEIYPLDETRDYIVGVVNLRGRIVVIIDLLLRFGHPPRAYSTADSLIFIEHADKVVGILVNDAEILDIDDDDILSKSVYQLNPREEREAPFVSGVIKWREGVAMRLHLENLLELSVDPDFKPESVPSPTDRLPYADAENVVFRARAHQLAQPIEEEEAVGQLALAVVRLGREFFGVELHTIREFVDLRNVALIPCCPPHIIGQTSLRGDLITVIDIADSLGLPPRSDVEDRKLMVMQDKRLAAGVIVDELLNVLYVAPSSLNKTSTITHKSESGLGREHFRGTTTLGSRMLTLIDLSALLNHQSLQVNENPQ